MRIKIWIALLLSFHRILIVNGNEPLRNSPTDAMLFGDVKSDGEHVPFATVSIKGTTIGTAADASGHFKITNLPVGNQTVIITAVGYKPFVKEMEFISNQSVTILAELDSDNIGIEQVIISADRNAVSRRRSATVVNSISSKIFQQTQSVTLSEGLSFSPGLRMENNCQNCGFSQLRMNGLEGPYTQILVNSRPVFSGLAGVYGLELIPANMIERVEVIRGGGSAMYGSNAIAGTVNLITKDPISDAFVISGNSGAVGVSGESDPASDFSLNMNGSFVSDDYRTGVTLFGFFRNRNPYDANEDGFSEMALVENSTFGMRFYQRTNTRGKLSGDYFHIKEYRRGGNRFELPLHEADIAESVDHSIHSAAATYDLLLREADKLSLFVSVQMVDRASYYGANQDLSAYGQTGDLTFNAGLDHLRHFDHLIFAPAALNFGMEIGGSRLTDEKLGYFDWQEGVHYGNTRIADQNLLNQALFLQSEWKSDPWVVAVGLRYDHYEVKDLSSENKQLNGHVFSPRLNLMYNLGRQWQLRAGLAQGFRAPQIFDEDLHIETSGSRKVLHRNSPDLKQETSQSFTLSLNHIYEEGRWQYQMMAEGFYTRLQNPFMNEYGLPDADGVVVYTRTNASDGAEVSGINIELNASPSNRLQLQSGFTIQHSGYEKPQMFNETRFFRSPNRYGFFSLNYQPTPRLSFTASGTYTGEMLIPYFGPEAEDPDSGLLRQSYPFADAGLRVAYSIRITDLIKMELNGGVKNIFNSYQKDFDRGVDRDPGYIYGPTIPRMFQVGVRFGNFL